MIELEVQVVLSILGLLVGAICTIGAAFYKLGKVHEKTEKHEKDLNELFDRTQRLELVASRFEDAVSRFEKMLNNGVGAKLAQMDLELAKLKQHCDDVQRSYGELCH